MAVHVEPRRRGNPYLFQTKDDYDELGTAEHRHYYHYTAGNLHSSTMVSRSAAGETTTVQYYYDEAGLPKERLVSPYRELTSNEDQLRPVKRFRYLHERS